MGRRLYSWKPAKRASGHLTSPAIATPHPPGPSYPFLSSPPENGFQPIQDFKKRGDMGGSRGHTDCDKAQTDVIGVQIPPLKLYSVYYYIYWKLCSFLHMRHHTRSFVSSFVSIQVRYLPAIRILFSNAIRIRFCPEPNYFNTILGSDTAWIQIIILLFGSDRGFCTENRRQKGHEHHKPLRL